LRFQPRHEVVINAERFEPARPWHACDGSRPPHARSDQGPIRREIDTLACPAAQHGMHAGLDEEGEMGVGTQAPLGHEDIPWLEARMDRLHPGQSVSEAGRDHELQEHTGARMEPPQPSRHGNAAPRPRLCWRAERFLSGRGLGHGTSRAIDEKRAMTMPPPFVQGRRLHRAAEPLEQASEEAQREFGPRVTVGRRREPPARQMGPMTAGGVAMQHLQEAAVDGGDRREHAVAPCGIPELTAHRQKGFGLQPHGPLTGEAWQDGRHGRDHWVTSAMMGTLTPIHTGDARRIPTSA
jgi:hypothetical protein